MPSSHKFVAILAFLVVGTFSSGASAQEQDIVQLNQDGITAFSEGRFADAAAKFRDAFAISSEPPLKKNEALAWFKAERCAEALGAAKEYLTLNTGDELSNSEARTIAVRCYIQRAEGEVAAGDHTAATASLNDAKANQPSPEDQAKITELESKAVALKQAEEQKRLLAQQAAAEAAAQQEAANSNNDMLAYGLMGGGGAIIVGTLVYHIALATGTSSKFREAAENGDQAQYDKLGKRLETGNWLVPTLYAVGAATTGVGAYFWWSGRREQPATATLPAGVGEFGVGIAGRF